VPFTITAPLDPRLPNGGGKVITMYNLEPEKLGVVDNVVTVSDNYRIYNGIEATAQFDLPEAGFLRSNYSVNSAIAGVPLTGGGSILVNLVEPNTVWNDYFKVLDVRIAKTMTTGRLRTVALVEIENLLNMSNVITVQEACGPRWLRPTTIQRGRNLRFGTQIRF
jgi:hypothetical protein